ncbi:class I SAM-dependent methyltransferase [Oscillatoria amoena NRMC-F 0135]|nr:class I SAM-dependent methyltransferase [Oscillatoria amoena NRMC-F 0135]
MGLIRLLTGGKKLLGRTSMSQFSCPICQSDSTISFLNREQVPVHQNLVINKQDAAIHTTRGNLYLRVCQECGFIFNQAFEPTKLSYEKNYDNSQTYSLSFSNYLKTLIDRLVNEKNVRHCQIVEVGCGKGWFLRKLVEVEEWGNVGYGFDPSYVGSDKDLNNRLQFEKRYYNSDCSDVPADVVICRHVIEHVPNPLNLLLSINQALSKSTQARVFF